MKLNHLILVADAVERISEIAETDDIPTIVDALVGIAWDKDDAEQIKAYHKEKEDHIMSKYTAAQIKNWDVDTETPSGKWIPARPINPTSIITRFRHALGVLTGRYDVLDWEQEARAALKQEVRCGELQQAQR